jgi:TolA-binding protein
MAYAQQAFQNGLYDAAQTRLQEFLAKYPASSLQPEARWLLGQTHFFLGAPAKGLEIFRTPPPATPDKLKPGFLFWEAECLAALQRWDQAAALYQKFLASHPADPLAPKARIGLSGVLQRNGKTDDALATLQPLLEPGLGDPAARLATLQQARILIAASRLPEAESLLASLTAQKPDPATTYEAAFWSGEIALQRNQPAQALDAFRKITGDGRAQPRDLVPRAWFGTGMAHLAAEAWDEAAKAFEQAYTTALDPAVIDPAVVRFLEASTKTNTLAKAALRVRQFVRKKQGTSVSGIYAIARFYHEAGNDDAAIAELDYLINNHPDSDWKWEAKILMAECLKRKGDQPAALATLEDAATQSKSPAIASRVQLLQGQWLFDAEPAAAADKFLAAAKSAPDPEAQEDAHFRALLALAKAGDLTRFNQIQDDFSKKSPQSPRLPEILMEKARLLDAAGKPEDARKIYSQITQDGAGPSPQTASALYQLALSSLEAGETEAALDALRRIEAGFPDFPQRADAAYQRTLLESNLNTLTDESVRQAWEAFLEAYPNHPKAGHARFQLAEWFARQGNLSEAQARFSALAADLPRHPLAPYAHYHAGASAFRAGDFKAALAILEKIPEASPVKTDARLLQIRCFMQQGQFDSALQVAESVTANRKEDPAWVEASLRKLGALYTLAANDPKRYDAALKTADTILASSAPNAAQRNEAGFVRGQILAKLNQPDQALNAYLDVVYGRLLPGEVTRQPTEPEFHWFIKSGIAAAQIREDRGDIRGAVEIYRILERLGDPNREEFRKKIEDLKSRHFLFEEA